MEVLFFEYEGSLTQPPCEPGVKWYVRANPIVAEAQQISAIRDLLKVENPPEGNFRVIQPTGGRDVELIAATDINDPKNVAVGIVTQPPAAEEGAGPDLTAEITGNPEFDKITGDETPEVLEAKRSYQNARLSAEGAKVAYIQAKADLSQAQGLYEKAPGMVEKIDLKWVIIDKTNNLNAKTIELQGALKKYEAALSNCVTVVAKSKGELAPPTTTPTPTEAGSTDVATTRVPTEIPPRPTVFPEYKLNYNPRYEVPQGLAGNPFQRGVAEVTPRVGGSSGQAQYFPYLRQNLHQPEGGYNVPVPGVVKVTTTTTPPPTTAPPVTLNLKLNVPKSDISDEAAFKEGLAEGLASSAGVNVSRVIVENVTETQSSVLLQEESRPTRLRHMRHYHLF